MVFTGLSNLIGNLDNFILVDLGGASTELTIKKSNYIDKIFLDTGAVYFNKQIDLNSLFKNSSQNVNNIENVILVGGSFVSLFFAIQKFKIFKRFNILNNSYLLYLFNALLFYNNSDVFNNLFKLFLFNILRRVLVVEKIFKFSKKIFYIFLFIFFVFF